MLNLLQNAFEEPRKEGDICLVREITQALAEAGHPNPERWTAVVQAKTYGASPKLQRFLINRSLRLILGGCEEDSTAVRYCLFDDGDHGDYLKIFKDVVAPFMIKNNL